MSRSIKLSPKYGLNAALTTCFWCGETSGIAICGKISGKDDHDMEAPKYVFGGYEPCENCKEKMKLGTAIMEADTWPVFEGQPEMQKKVYPTGRWVVLRKEAAKRIFNCDSDKAFCDKKTFEMLTAQGK